MQQHPLLPRRDVQDRTDLLGVVAFHVAQRDHRRLRCPRCLALFTGSPVDPGLQCRTALKSAHPLITASNVSCAASSAEASVDTRARASRGMPADQASSIRINIRSSCAPGLTPSLRRKRPNRDLAVSTYAAPDPPGWVGPGPPAGSRPMFLGVDDPG